MSQSIPHILLVEPDRTLARTMMLNLAVRGYSVGEADSVESGFEMALAACEAGVRFDLIVLDTHLPDGSGWDLLRRLRAAEDPLSPWQPVPTVVISSLPVARSRITEFAPIAALQKPFPIEALLRLITRLHEPSATTIA